MTGRPLASTLLFSILAMVLTFTGCTGRVVPTATQVRGVVRVAMGKSSRPVEGAIVSFADRATVTDAQGIFDMKGISPGTYQVEVCIPINASTGIVGSLAKSARQEARVWSGDVNVSSAGLVRILVTPLASVLRYGLQKWQLGFYAYPPARKSIVEGSISTPNGRPGLDMELQEHFEPQWHHWWSVDSPEPGLYLMTIALDDGSRETIGIYMTEETFSSIERPQQIDPQDKAELDTTTPLLTYTVPLDSEAVHVRITDTETGNEVWLRDRPSTGVQVPYGTLIPGKEYMWRVHVVNRPAVLPWSESISDERYFVVQDGLLD